VTFDFRVPEVVGRIAQEDGRKGGPDTIDNDEAQHDPTGRPLGLGDRDAQILNRNRYLGRAQGQLVEKDAKIEGLSTEPC
jgi:hypothetical protein